MSPLFSLKRGSWALTPMSFNSILTCFDTLLYKDLTRSNTYLISSSVQSKCILLNKFMNLYLSTLQQMISLAYQKVKMTQPLIPSYQWSSREPTGNNIILTGSVLDEHIWLKGTYSLISLLVSANNTFPISTTFSPFSMNDFNEELQGNNIIYCLV